MSDRIFTPEDYAYIGRAVADSYKHALKRAERFAPATGSDFAANLKNARELMGLTQEEAAKRAGLKGSAWSHFETGKRSPNLKNLRALCLALGVSSDRLLGINHPSQAARRVGFGPLFDQ